MNAPTPDKLEQLRNVSTQFITFAVVRLPETDTVYIGGSDFKVYSVNIAANKFEPVELYAHKSYVTGLARTGDALVSGGYDGTLVWWDLASGRQVRGIDAHSKWIRKVIASPDGKLVASVADDMVCRLWDGATGRNIHELRGHAEMTPHHYTSMLYAAAFSADGKYLATADKVGHIVIWDVQAGKQVGSCEAPVMYTWDKVQRMHSIGGVRSLAFSPDGSRLAAGGTNKINNIDHLEAKARVEVFDWQAGKQVAEFSSDKVGIVNRLQWSPDGAWLMAAGGAGEGFLLFLDAAAKKALRQEKMPMHVHDFDLSADCKELVCVGHNRITMHKLG
jgi:WD40 repeat protein